jgi:hypothetical protein
VVADGVAFKMSRQLVAEPTEPLELEPLELLALDVEALEAPAPAPPVPLLLVVAAPVLDEALRTTLPQPAATKTPATVNVATKEPSTSARRPHERKEMEVMVSRLSLRRRRPSMASVDPS